MANGVQMDLQNVRAAVLRTCRPIMRGAGLDKPFIKEVDKTILEAVRTINGATVNQDVNLVGISIPSKWVYDINNTFLYSGTNTRADYRTIAYLKAVYWDNVPLTPRLTQTQRSELYSQGSDIVATGTLTFTSNPTNGKIVTLGTTVYTFKTVISSPYDVAIGTVLADSVANLVAAVMADANGAGTKYWATTTAHPTMAAFVGDTTAKMVVMAQTAGTDGNSLATTTDVTGATWASATLSGGAGQADSGDPQWFEYDGLNRFGLWPPPGRVATMRLEAAGDVGVFSANTDPVPVKAYCMDWLIWRVSYIMMGALIAGREAEKVLDSDKLALQTTLNLMMKAEADALQQAAMAQTNQTDMAGIYG